MAPLIEILFFALLSFYLFFRLWSVLGKKTGLDSRPPQIDEGPTGAKIIPLPSRDRPEIVQEQAPQAHENYTIEEKAKADLDAIAQADSSFTVDRFARGACKAYGMIVEAFGKEDLDTLKRLLGAAVYKQFSQAIKDRQSIGEQLDARVVTINKMAITAAKVTGKKSSITVRFDSEQILFTKDGGGIIHDNPARLSMPIRDQWIFTRDLGSESPNWLVTGTKSLNEEIAS